MNPNPNLEELRKALGLPNAPLVMNGLGAAAGYFTTVLKVSPFKWIDYLKGIDFHKDVQQVILNRGRELARHKPDNPAFKPFLYFTDPGHSPMRTGTNFPNVTFERYEVTSPISALESAASSISFSPTDRVSRPGGARQYIIPAADFRWLKRV
jgi:hypothetical protein